MRSGRRRLAGIVLIAAAGCTGPPATRARPPDPEPAPEVSLPPPAPAAAQPTTRDVYANDRPGQLSDIVKGMPTRIYVPNSVDSTLDEVDPATGAITSHVKVAKHPQHVVPSWDLRTLYVASDQGNSLTPIDPISGAVGASMPVPDPYNLYFTPDGKSAIVVAERLGRLDFRDSRSFALQRSVPVPCRGVDHMDFSADGAYLLASCEFSGSMVKVELGGAEGPKLAGAPLVLSRRAKPQDVKLSPDGSLIYVADMVSGGVWEIDGDRLAVVGFLPTGAGAHGLYVSRDSTVMFVSNRDEGSVSVVDLATRAVRTTWRIPGRATPDMGGVSADGTTLWLSGRSSSEIYALDTTTGELRSRIAVGAGPHGLSIYPQPGTYSLGHTGVFR